MSKLLNGEIDQPRQDKLKQLADGLELSVKSFDELYQEIQRLISTQQSPSPSSIPLESLGIDALVQGGRPSSESHKNSEDSLANLSYKLIQAFREKDIIQLETIFKSIELDKTDCQEYQQITFLYLFLRHELGDIYSSLKQLKDLSKDLVLASRSYFWLGRCWESSRDFNKAIKAFKKSIEYFQRDEEKVQALGGISRCLLKLNNPKEAVHNLSSELNNLEESDEKYKLYEHLASIYQDLEEPKTRAIVLEKTVSGLRNDTELLSKLAFLHHEIGLHTLSLLHYQSLLELIPDEKYFINMIGIQYERLNLPISAARAYKKAADLGGSIAASNLFYLYLNAPIHLSVFPEEVEQLLENYKNQVDVEPNVLSALSDICRFKDKEKEDELKHLKDARRIQDFLLLFVDEYFIKKPSCTNALDGLWYSEEKDRSLILKISSDESQIKAVFIIDFDTRDFFIGQEANQAAIINFPNEDVGYAYLSLGAQHLHIMRLDGCQPILFMFVRNKISHD